MNTNLSIRLQSFPMNKTLTLTLEFEFIATNLNIQITYSIV